MSVWCCSHFALQIAKLPLEQWAGEIEKLPTTCMKDCGAPRSCRERNAEYLRTQYRAIKNLQNMATIAERAAGMKV